MLRRTTAILATAAAITLAVVAPAPAETIPDNHTPRRPPATALQLTLLGQTLAVSQTQAAVGQSAEGVPPQRRTAPRCSSPAHRSRGCPVRVRRWAAEPTRCARSSSTWPRPPAGALSALQLEVACVRTTAANGDRPSALAPSPVRSSSACSAPVARSLEPILSPVLDGLEQVTDPLVEALAPAPRHHQRRHPDRRRQRARPAAHRPSATTLFVLAEIVVAPTVSQASATRRRRARRGGQQRHHHQHPARHRVHARRAHQPDRRPRHRPTARSSR